MMANLKRESVYHTLNKRRIFALGLFLIALFLFAFWDIITGSSSLSAWGTLKIILEGPTGETKYHFIVWSVRMPMTLTCVCVGASLGLSGDHMQTILQNPLASPYTLGISAAAGFGASLGVVTGFPYIPIGWLNNAVSALLFALGASMLIYVVCSKWRGGGTKGMILLGIVVNFLFSALQTLMQYMANQEQLAEMMHWMFGSLTKASWNGVVVCGINFVIFFVLSMRLSWQLTSLTAGEERARSLGINTDKLRSRVFLYSAFLTAVAVSYVGSIGFIGLVAPHLARSYVGEDQRYLEPLSAMFGVIILLAASLLSKMLKPGEILPVGIITNLVGVVFLLYLILRRKV